MDVELRPRAESGFSLIEVFIAGALLLIITLGMVPLFTRSLRDNQSGAESSQVSNVARSQLEEFFQLPWDSTKLTLVSTDPDSGRLKVFGHYFSQADQLWKSCADPPPTACDPLGCNVPADDPARWVRTTCVRQFSNDDVTDDGVLADDEALAFDAPANQVHLKEIIVRVQGSDQSVVFGPARRLTVRTLKAQ